MKVNINTLSQFLQSIQKQPIKKLGAGSIKGDYVAEYLILDEVVRIEIPELTGPNIPLGYNKKAMGRIASERIYHLLALYYPEKVIQWFGVKPSFEDFEPNPQRQKNILQIIQSSIDRRSNF